MVPKKEARLGRQQRMWPRGNWDSPTPTGVADCHEGQLRNPWRRPPCHANPIWYYVADSSGDAVRVAEEMEGSLDGEGHEFLRKANWCCIFSTVVFHMAHISSILPSLLSHHQVNFKVWIAQREISPPSSFQLSYAKPVVG